MKKKMNYLTKRIDIESFKKETKMNINKICFHK